MKISFFIAPEFGGRRFYEGNALGLGKEEQCREEAKKNLPWNSKPTLCQQDPDLWGKVGFPSFLNDHHRLGWEGR